jgi:hypothetical protein
MNIDNDLLPTLMQQQRKWNQIIWSFVICNNTMQDLHLPKILF